MSVKDKLTLSLGVAVGSSIVSVVSVRPYLARSNPDSVSKLHFSSFRTCLLFMRRYNVRLILFSTVLSQFWGGSSANRSLSFSIHSSLSFSSLQVRLLTFSARNCTLIAFPRVVLTVNYVVQDGKSNWLEGMILMCTPAVVIIPSLLISTFSRSLRYRRGHVLVLSWE